jgi:hypothetical protein
MSGKIVAAVLTVVAARVGAGQQPLDLRVVAPPAAPGPATLAAPCDTVSAPANAYATCALRNEGFVIRQGAAGVVVARPGAFHSLALTRLVSGDSAVAHARLFETQQHRANVFGIARGVAFLGSAALLLVDRHQSGFNRHEGYIPAALTLNLVGLGLAIPQAVFSRRAAASLSTALWWNNQRFAK